MHRPAPLLSLLAVVALLLASCGDGEESTTTTTTDTGAAEAGAASENDVYVGAIEVAPSERGPQVRSLEIGSPVASAGLLGADVIVAVDDTPIETPDDLATAIRALAETYDGGDQFELTVARGKAEKTLTVTLAGNVYLGAELTDAKQGGGAAVKSVPKGGPAAEAGIEPGDVIVAIDSQPVTEFDDLLQALATHSAGDEVEIEVTRGSQEQTLTATLAIRGHQVQAQPGG